MNVKILLTLILSCIIQLAYGQIEDFQKYYQIDSLIRKCKVKRSTDYPTAVPEQIYVTEYDKLGRQTSWYYLKDSVRTHYEYLTKKDTLLKYHYCSTNGKKDKYYKLEKFVYNSKNKIVYYLSQNENYGKDSNTAEVVVDRFYYEKSILIKSEHWYRKKYPTRFSVTLFPNDTLLKLLNEYQYVFNRKGQLISRMEKSDKPQFDGIDSFFYDTRNRLVKSLNFRENGYVGEFRAYNVRNTTELIYTSNSIIEINSMKSDLRNEYENKIEKELNINKLEIKMFGYYDNKKELISRTSYEYY
jgi:hypothetical protein